MLDGLAGAPEGPLEVGRDGGGGAVAGAAVVGVTGSAAAEVGGGTELVVTWGGMVVPAGTVVVGGGVRCRPGIVVLKLGWRPGMVVVGAGAVVVVVGGGTYPCWIKSSRANAGESMYLIGGSRYGSGSGNAA